MKKIIVLFIALLLLAGCKTQVVGLQQHPSFDYNATAKHQFIIAGVVSSVEQLDHMTRIRYGDLLGRTFHDQQPHIKMIRPGYVINAIGGKVFTDVLDEYRMTGVVRDQDIDALHDVFPAARYVMFCRIDMNQVSQHHNETENDVADSEEDRKKGEYEQVRVDVSLETRRQMGATLSIYDLNDKLMVWSGYVTKVDSNSNISSRTFNKDSRWQEEVIAGFIDAMVGFDSRNYPNAPRQLEVLEDIFAGFAENMPEAQ